MHQGKLYKKSTTTIMPSRIAKPWYLDRMLHILLLYLRFRLKRVAKYSLDSKSILMFRNYILLKVGLKDIYQFKKKIMYTME